MRRETILFDMDGVLIDSEYCMRTSGIMALKEFGVEATHEDFMEFTGMGEDRFIGGTSEKLGVPYRTVMKDRAYEIYGEIADQYIVVFDGIREMILTLRSRGYRIAVASAADLVKVLINLRCIGLSKDDFDAVVTGNDTVNKKPDPEIYLTAAKRIGADPARCIVVEDAVAGVQAGRAAGAVCIGVTSTYTAEELRAAGAFYTVDKTPQILDFIDAIE